MENRLIKKIRNHIIHIGLAIVLCSAFLGMPVAVHAQDGGPSLPHNFWGYVETDTGDPATGVEVTAWIGGEQRGSTTTDSTGKYGSDPLTGFPFYLTVTGVNDDIIEFRVDGIVAEEVRWGVLIEEEPRHWEWTDVDPSFQVVFVSAEVNGLDLVYTPGPVDNTPPAAIADLVVSGVTSDSATLAWTAPGDDGTTGTASSYDVRYLQGSTPITESNWASATEASGEPTPQVAGSSETFTVTGLDSGTEYYFAVKTSDEVPNESDISNSPSGTTEETDTTAPAAITDLDVSMVTSDSATLTWTAPGDDGTTGTASSYNIRYLQGTTPITESNWASATEASGEPAPQVAGSGQMFIVTGLDAETTYYFAIKTSDEVPNESDVSNSPSGTTEEIDDTPPAAITNLAVSGVTGNSATLTWTAPGDDDDTGTATSYNVRYLQDTAITGSNWSSATQASGVPTPQAAGSSETFTVTGLNSETTYYFAIKTSDEVPNESDISNSPSGTTEEGEIDDTPPAAITDLAISNTTSSSVTLTWTAPGDDGTTGTASSYDVRYLMYTAITGSNWASASQASGVPAPQVAGSTETFTVTNLSSNTEYFFAIKTSDEVPNDSDISNSTSGTTSSGGGGGGGTTTIVTDNTAPGPVADLAVSGVTSSSVTLTWTAPGDDGYEGTASEYDVRYLEGTIINESNWDSASQATGVPAPQAAGSSETFTVTGLDAETNYHFAVKTADEVPIWSGVSNSPSAATSSAGVVTTEEEEEEEVVTEEEEEEVVTEEEEELVTEEEEEEVVTEEEEEEEISEPAPAAFIITNISISPETPALDETVTITIDVTNTGETEGTYSVVLRINGEVEATQSITLDGGETGQVVFTTSKDEAGDYTVGINGQSTSFTVAQPVRLVLIFGVVGGVILLGLLIYLGRRIYYARM